LARIWKISGVDVVSTKKAIALQEVDAGNEHHNGQKRDERGFDFFGEFQASFFLLI
jgi:hypothetical protein